MFRILLASLLAAGALLAPLGAAPTTAADPTIIHIIDSVHADANFTTTDATGCLQTDIWISSGEGTYSQPPGAPTTQGLTSVDIFVSDLCAEAEAVTILAAGGGGGVPVAAWHAQTLDPLEAWPHVAGATFAAEMLLVDEVTGASAMASVDLLWIPAGPIDHYTVNLGEHWQHVGMVRGNTNWWFRDATVSGSIVLGGSDLIGGLDGIGHLERGKWHCVENAHPHWDGVPDWCV